MFGKEMCFVEENYKKMQNKSNFEKFESDIYYEITECAFKNEKLRSTV